MTEKDFSGYEKLVDYLHSLSILKFRKREGWLSINIHGDNCETIAAHSFRVGIIAYHLAILKGIPRDEAMRIGFIALNHDLEETKLGDLTPAQKKYIKADRKKACEDSLYDKELANDLEDHRELINDADKLDMVLQAKEYVDVGNRYAIDWLKSGKALLKSKEARYLAELIESIDSKKWVFRDE